VSRFLPRLEILEDRTALSTLTVLNNLDGGAGSLRDTIAHAKDGDTIVFDPGLNGQTIALTSDELAIKKSLDIEGPGADKLAVSGSDAFRVFDIVNQGLTVTIAGLTITEGLGSGDLGGGGVLVVGSTLALTNDLFSYNQAVFGGNFFASGGALGNWNGASTTVTGCTFLSNVANGQGSNSGVAHGGAIENDGTGANRATLTILNSTFIANKAIGGNGVVATSGKPEVGNAHGGAIANAAHSTLTVAGCTFSDNMAIAGNGGSGGHGTSVYIVDVATGGGIQNDEGGILVVDGCVFSSNRAIGGSNASGFTSNSRVGHAIGGAVQNSASATVTNSTFDHNEALGGSNNPGGGSLILGRGAGGAIGSFSFLTEQATLTVSNCTFTGNRAVGGTGNTGGPSAGQGVGGAILNERGSIATVTGSTFTGNQAIGCQGGAGSNGADGLGGGIANLFGATLTVSGCTLSGNQALGGAGGSGANGGNGFGGGLFNDGPSAAPGNAGTPATLTITGSTITDNQATGGAAGSGGSAGQGVGGGAYFASGGVVCLDAFTQAHVSNNQASTSDDDLFGAFTTCP
jgi:hypothetical protein